MAATDGPDGLMPTGYITSSLGMRGLGPDGITSKAQHFYLPTNYIWDFRRFLYFIEFLW